MTEPATAYALARILRRDRQTIQRVVDRLAPDDFKDGRPRWAIARVAAMLDLTARERREAGRFRDRFSVGRSKNLDGLLVMFEKQLAAIEAEPWPDEQCALALALAPLLVEFQALYIDTSRSLRVADDDQIGTRADLILEEMVGEIAEAAGRDGDGAFFGEMIEAMAAAEAA